MYQIKQSEATAARRRIPVLLVDITDGFTPKISVVTPTINISKLGAAIATGAGTWTEIGNGQYYYEFTAGEVDTLGWIAVNIVKATVSRDYNAIVQVMAYDYAVATNLGLTAIPAVATGSAGAIPTTGSGANQIAVNGSGAVSTVVSVSGSVGSVVGAVGSVTGNVSGSVASVVGAVGSVTGAVGSVTGNVGGNVTGSVGSLTATAVQNIWDDLTINNTVVGSVGKLIGDNLNAPVGNNTPTNVWSFATRLLTAGTNIVLAKGTGITGFNDISAQNVWDVATSGLTTVGSIGLKLNTNVDTTISSRMATFTYTTPPTSAAIATQVWSEPIPGTFAVGSAGAKLNSASSAGDPWATALPGSYAAGTAGNILGNRLDAAITSRMATFTYTVPPTTVAIATQVWSEALPGTYTSGQAGFKLNAAGSAADPWSTALPGSYSAGSAGFIIGNRLDTNVGSRMATFTLPTNFSSLAITVGGAITAGTVSDKTGYSLSTSQTFNTTGSIGSVVGSVGSVAGSVAGNVAGTVASVVGNLGGNVVGSVGSVVGAVGSVSNVSNIWDYLTTSILTTNSIGLLLKTNVDAQISTRLASSSYTASPTTAQIMSAIWNQTRATANGGITPVAGTFGYFLDSRVSTAGGGGGGVIIKQGPFTVSSTELGPNNVLDLVVGDNRNIQLSIVDEFDENIPLNVAYTYSVKTYDIASTLVATYAATLDYATGGLLSFDIDTVTTANRGTYNVVIVENNGTSNTIYGGLKLEVRL
jgi:hypothetical protein